MSADYRFAQTILNAISAHVAILDESGFILETNRAWKQFAEQNQIQMRPDTLDINYLEVCDRAGEETAGDASLLTPQEIEVAALIREGRSSKEIAEQLHLSITTVNFHRRNLRDKLNLRHTGTNLRTFLVGLKKT